MFQKISVRLTDMLQDNGIIQSENRKICEYGIRQLFIILLNIISDVFIGILFGMMSESIIFLIAYMSLRRFAGGFHSRSPVMCYVYSMIIIAGNLWIVKIWLSDKIIISILLLLLIGSILIFLLSPVEDMNKPLDMLEYKVYHKKCFFILIVEIIFYAVVSIVNLRKAAVVISVAVFNLGLIVLLGKVKNKLVVQTKAK